MKIRLSRLSWLIAGVALIFNSVGIQLTFFNNAVTATDITTMIALNLAQSLLMFLYCFERGKFKERFAYFSFSVAYLILLQGAYICNLGNENFYGKYIFTTVCSISYANEVKGLFYILFMQYVVYMSYCSMHRRTSNIHPKLIEENIERYANYSMIFMILGGIAAFIKVILKVAFVAAYGYLGTYLVTGNSLYQNPLIDLFDKFYFLGLYGYLATFPRRKKLWLPVGMYIIYSLLSLMTGGRGEIVINILFLVWYFSKRDDLIKDGAIILTKKRIAIMGILAVFFFVFLYEFGYSRVGVSSGATGFLQKIFNFVEAQGGSGHLTALAFQYREAMLKYISPFLMIFSPIKNFLVNNSLARIFTGGILGQSMDTLLRGASFGSVLTYVTNPASYLGGAGLGTSFVAEAAVSSGLIGTIGVGVVLGKLLRKLDLISLSNWKANVFWMNAFTTLVYIPRHSTLGIIPDSVGAIIFIMMICILKHEPVLKFKRNSK